MHPYRSRVNGDVLGISNNGIGAGLYILGKHKAFFPRVAKMTYIINDIRKFWYYHLTNVALFALFSGMGVLLAMGFHCAIKRAEEQATMQILMQLPPKMLAEIQI